MQPHILVNFGAVLLILHQFLLLHNKHLFDINSISIYQGFLVAQVEEVVLLMILWVLTFRFQLCLLMVVEFLLCRILVFSPLHSHSLNSASVIGESNIQFLLTDGWTQIDIPPLF